MIVRVRTRALRLKTPSGGLRTAQRAIVLDLIASDSVVGGPMTKRPDGLMVRLVPSPISGIMLWEIGWDPKATGVGVQVHGY